MKVTFLILLAAFAAMWFTTILQNTLAFFVCTLVFVASATLDGNTLQKDLKRFLVYMRFLRSRIFIDRSIRPSKSNRIFAIAKPVLKNESVMLIQKKISSGLERKVRTSGRAYNPRILAQQSIAYMVLSLFLIAPIAAVLGVFVEPYLFLLVLCCPVWLFYPRIKLWFVVSERKSLIDDEMAFFTLYASVMQSIGQSLYTSIAGVVGKRIFPMIESEGRMLVRDVQIFGIDQITALNEHGYSHPNPSFRNLLLGYASICQSGGNLALYMDRKADEFFHKMQFKYVNYKSQAHIIGETVLILLTIFPTMILVSSFMLAEDSVRTVLGLSFVFIPVATVFIILLSSASQPKIKNEITFDTRSIFVAAFVFGLSLLFGQPPWFVIGVGVAAGAIYNFVSSVRQFREISFVESALPDFFRDITEYRKIGIPISNAIIKISQERAYNKYFDGIILALATHIRHGASFLEVLDFMVIRSWIARTSFFVLGKIADSGGGTAQTIEQITSFSTSTHQTKKETQASISVISYFAFFSPLMMVYTTKEMISILQKLNGSLDQMVQSAFSIESMLVSDELIGTINLLIVLTTISIGLVMSKLVHFSMKYSVTLGMAVLVSLLSIILSPLFPSLVRI